VQKSIDSRQGPSTATALRPRLAVSGNGRSPTPSWPAARPRSSPAPD